MTNKILTKLNQQGIKSTVSHLSVCHRTAATFASHMTPTWQKVNQTLFSYTVALSANILFTALIPAFLGIPSCSIVIITVPFLQRQGTGMYAETQTEVCSAGGLVSTLPVLLTGHLTLIGIVLRWTLKQKRGLNNLGLLMPHFLKQECNCNFFLHIFLSSYTYSGLLLPWNWPVAEDWHVRDLKVILIICISSVWPWIAKTLKRAPFSSTS